MLKFAHNLKHKNKHMKNILTLFTVLALALNIYAQEADEAPKDGPVIKFEEETIDYGTIKRYADGHREFKFTNTGTEPLSINNCAGTCGCTVPACPKEPVLPGESGSIKVKYATDRIGQFNKGVKVYSNATPADQPIMVYIKGNVLAEEDSSHVKKDDAPEQKLEPTHKPEPVKIAEPVKPADPHAGHNHPH